MEQRSITDVLQEHTSRLLALPGVVGAAQGLCSGRPCIRVFVENAAPEVLARIPSSLEGHPVEVEVSGGFAALGP